IKADSGASTEDITGKIDALNTASQAMGAAMYAAAAEQGEAGDVPGAEAPDGTQPSGDAAGATDDDVVDAEVVEDDTDKEKK
ncbi:MAG: molecular chaperone DnaK, partial [Phycicoccus sp.]